MKNILDFETDSIDEQECVLEMFRFLSAAFREAVYAFFDARNLTYKLMEIDSAIAKEVFQYGKQSYKR